MPSWKDVYKLYTGWRMVINPSIGISHFTESLSWWWDDSIDHTPSNLTMELDSQQNAWWYDVICHVEHLFKRACDLATIGDFITWRTPWRICVVLKWGYHPPKKKFMNVCDGTMFFFWMAWHELIWGQIGYCIILYPGYPYFRTPLLGKNPLGYSHPCPSQKAISEEFTLGSMIR
jgi:hypothetical protein